MLSEYEKGSATASVSNPRRPVPALRTDLIGGKGALTQIAEESSEATHPIS